MIRKQTIFFLLPLTLILVSFRSPADGVEPGYLRCELLVDPHGIDVQRPELSWEIASRSRAVEQTAYQILVASSAARLAAGEGDVWNSGKVASDKSVHVPYAGKKLNSRMECYWKVKVWTSKAESDWSKPAFWSMGLLNTTDWKARWTGMDRAFAWDSVSKFARLSARYFRKEFTAGKKIKRATLYISGLGMYEAYLNGKKIGDQVLAPSPTDYSKAVKYNTFDVTAEIKQGANAIGTVLGNGRFFTMRQNYKPQKWHTFGYPKMLLQLELDLEDGTRQTIVSDGSWKMTADGPIRTNNEYDGEEYDATKEITGWNEASYNESKWLPAMLVKAPGGRVEAQMSENMKVMETIKPVAIRALNADTFVLDMGQNMAGWLRIKVKGKAGDTVTLRFAESLDSTGHLYIANLRDAIVTDKYILKGGKEESWCPAFVFHGFRYAEVTGLSGKSDKDDFAGDVIYDNMQTTGEFETSNNTINQIHKNAWWGIRSNYKGMPIDCPQRNERQPWLGDRSTGAYGESFLFDNSRLYAKWLNDIEESQTPEGSIPDVAPNFWYYYKDDVTWPATYIMVANMLYNQYGDKRSIIRHYASMKKWMTYMRTKYMVNNLFAKDSYGDWCVPPESPELIHAKDTTRITDPKLLATASYYHMLQLMQRFAEIAGQPADVPAYKQLAAGMKKAFNDAFYHAKTRQYSNNTVTANILPLAFNLVPDGDGETIFQNIVSKTMNESKGHISTGVIGTQWLMRWLTLYGRADIAYRLASNRDYPSWGYMVANGATTIWELWNGNTANPSMNSQNHVMLLGDLLVWLYEDLAGIKTDPQNPGFKVLLMQPSFVDGLDHVRASYHSLHGWVRSEWQKEGNRLTWKITVPANTKAVISIPALSADAVTEKGRPAREAEGVKPVKMENGKAVFEIGSGEYSFEVKVIG